MKNHTMSLSQIRRIGLEALDQALGQVGTVRFLQQFEVGRGDYTQERNLWLDKMSVQDIANGIQNSRIWTSYDREADVLYINFKKPSHADDSDLTDDNIIIRYEGGEIVGITVLDASRRIRQGQGV